MTPNKSFIKQIKKIVAYSSIPPHYNPDEWKGKKFNCYAYALRICMDFGEYAVFPGFMTKVRKRFHIVTKKRVLKKFLEDCQVLGLHVIPTKLEEQTTSNGYKLAIYVKTFKDFHFVRQDDNGKWSEKCGWNGKIKILDSKNITKKRNGYKFIGVFMVSKKAA